VGRQKGGTVHSFAEHPRVQRRAGAGGVARRRTRAPGGVAGRGNARETAAGLAPPIVQEVLSAPGRPLDGATRGFMESRFGQDFSQVRIHADGRAAASAQAVNALAYTVGSSIAFDHGRYAPATAAGRHLLAHELAHVAQQGAGPTRLSPRLTLGAGDSPEEREAEGAAARVTEGGSVRVARSTEPGLAQRLQRVEHGTYVSRQGTQTYLDAGANFYRTWGHPNVLRVNTMEEVVTDLDRAQGNIDSFRIVSHGNSLGMQIGLLPEVSPGTFNTQAAGFTSEQPFRDRFTSQRLLSDAFFGRMLTALQADATSKPLLTALGAGAGTPAIDSPLGILLRAIAERHFVANVQLDTGGAANIANRGVIDAFNTQRIGAYSPGVIAAAANQQAARGAIRALPGEITRVMAAAGLVYGTLTQNEADHLADPFADPANAAQLNPELSRSISEGAGGPYLRRLRSVKGKVTANTHVEIRGCNVGDTPAFLDSLRNYFGSPGALPSISAPDLFQYFFQLNFKTYELRTASEVTRLQTDFADAGTGLEQGLTDRRRILGGERTRVVNDTTLAALAARYGHNARQVQNLNPEIDPAALVAGQDIWLVQRSSVLAGRYGTLADLCRDYLGNQAAAPQVAAANPHIADPAQLSPGDRITFPAALLGARVAGAAATAADLQTHLSGGGAVAALNTVDNRPEINLQNRNAHQALGAWLAAQNFDPQGRSAAALSALYAGRNFATRAAQTYIQFLSRSYPNIEDPIFPEDPRYSAHIIRRP
jgi:Domain of unknown function (DUF4157)/LysM domain